MSTVAQFSLAAYEHMASLGAFDGKFHRRVELVRGEILDMSPIGTEHAYFVNLLSRWSHREAPDDRVLVSVQNPVRIPALDSEPEPDLAWVVAKSYAVQHPEPSDVLLLIEVADSSLEFDRGEKLALYAEAGIPDYWLVNLIDEQFEIYRDPKGRSYRSKTILRGAEIARPLANPQASLKPSELFVR